MVNVIISKKRNISVNANSTAGIIDTRAPVTLRSGSSVGSGITRLDQLSDVDASTEIDNGVLFYDAAQDKYVVRAISFEEVSGGLDGGDF
jgi:hypothetical protein